MTVRMRDEANQTEDDQLMYQNMRIDEPDTARVAKDTTVNVSLTAPSMESGVKKVSLIKPEGTAAVVRITDSDAVSGEHTKVAKLDEACTFKRGRMCMKHGCIGQKYVISSKV